MPVTPYISPRVTRMFARSCLLVCTAACSLGDLVNNSGLPTDIQDPKVVKTQEGAMGAYYSAVMAFRTTVAMRGYADDFYTFSTDPATTVIGSSGLLTDELQSDRARSPNAAAAFPSGNDLIDARADAVPLAGPYHGLQVVRARAHEAISALRAYHPTAPLALTGHLLAIEGMAEVLLAELYCSGIPLSTLDFEGGYTLQPGSSTAAVFEHALQLFDSARVMTTDSVNFVHFASLGRARAFLGLQNVEAATLAVADVPTDYHYTVPIEGAYQSLFSKPSANVWFASVSDREGGIGLPFVTGGDPRSVSDSFATYGQWFPRKYRDTDVLGTVANPGKVAVVFASGIEARLIEAEAALLANRPDWLVMLNTLRTSCTSDESCPAPAPAGTGGIPNLPLLTDPALDSIPTGSTAKDVRLDLLFSERAYWMFLTGRRQADLRRLVQQYGRETYTVYPSGLWGRQQLAYYGSRTSLPVPEDERTNNALYRGCEDL